MDNIGIRTKKQEKAGWIMKKLSKLEAVLWNIALPGFSQLLAGKYLKGVLFIALEFIINVNSHFNLCILYSFQGQMDRAFEAANLQWLMFYPCVYMFAMWDAYRYAMPPDEKLSYLPFVFSAYFVTVGTMFGGKATIFGIQPGIVFFPMLSLIPGLLIGFILRSLLLKRGVNNF